MSETSNPDLPLLRLIAGSQSCPPPPAPPRSRMIRQLIAAGDGAPAALTVPGFDFQPCRWAGRVVGQLIGRPANVVATGKYPVFWHRGRLEIMGAERGTPHEEAIREACRLYLDRHRDTILAAVPVEAGAVYIVGSDGDSSIKAKSFWVHLGFDVIVTIRIDGKTVEVSPVDETLRGHGEIARHYRRWASANRNRLMCRARALHAGS